MGCCALLYRAHWPYVSSHRPDKLWMNLVCVPVPPENVLAYLRGVMVVLLMEPSDHAGVSQEDLERAAGGSGSRRPGIERLGHYTNLTKTLSNGDIV